MKKLVFIISVLLSTPIMANNFCNSKVGRDYVQQLKQAQSKPINTGKYQYVVQNADCRRNTLTIEFKVDDDPTLQQRRTMANNIHQQIDLRQMLCATTEVSQAAQQGLQRVVYRYLDRKGEIIMSLDATLNQCR